MVSLLVFVDRLMPTLNEAGSSLAGRTNTEQKMAQQKTKELILEAIGALPNAVGPDAAEKSDGT